MDASIISNVLTQCELAIDLCKHNAMQSVTIRNDYLPWIPAGYTDHIDPQNTEHAAQNSEWIDRSTI